MLVRTDNTAVVSYINHQGGLRSRPLCKLAHQILVWSQDKFLSLRAVYIPGHLNVGADILSRQGPRPGEIEASPRDGEADLESFWPGTGGSVCDSSDIALSPLVLSDSSSSAGAGCYGTDVAEASSVCLSPDCSAPGSSRESASGRGPAVASSPVLAGPSMVLGPDFSPRRLSMGDSSQERSPLTSGGYDLSPPPGVMEAVIVAPEGAQLIASGLSTEVLRTILQSRAPSTRKLYGLKWRTLHFLVWRPPSSTQLTARLVQYWSFCRLGSPQGYPTSTLRVYVAAIASYHTPLWWTISGQGPPDHTFPPRCAEAQA